MSSLYSAVQEAIAHLDLTPADRPAEQLALTYAAVIGSRKYADLDKLGPQLLNVLEALGMTPRARAALAKGGTVVSLDVDPLDELQRRRAKRLGGTEAVDPTAT